MAGLEDYRNANPPFRFQPTHAAVDALVPAGLKDQAWVASLLQHLGDRDRQLEDYLNHDVLRRVGTARVFGNATAHAGTAWQLVAPAVDVTYHKAGDASALVATVLIHGIYTDVGAPSWVEFGLLVNGTDYPIARHVCNTSGNHDVWVGSARISATTLVAGTYTCSLRVRGQNAGTAFTSHAQDTMSVTVVETA
jgi:hypothetical protein